MGFPKPRGRPKKDCVWCTITGAWKPIREPQPLHVRLPGANSRPHVRTLLPSAAPPPVEDPLEKERRRVEGKERARAFGEESARQRALEAERARAAEAKRLEEERISAPRRHAASLRGCAGAHVYYFDTSGDFQELGQERERPRPVSTQLARKRVRVTYDKWVYGPSEKRQLEADESELVTVSEWVWRSA